MAIFKIIGSIVRIIERDHKRVEETTVAYRLVRIAGNKPVTIHPDVYKNAASRAVKRAADYLGFTDGYQSAFVCNDSSSNSTANMQAFDAYDSAVIREEGII